jgi:hypothetical protein
MQQSHSRSCKRNKNKVQKWTALIDLSYRLNGRDFDDTSWWLKEVLLFPFMTTGANRLYTKLRQSAVGVATSMT